MALVKMTIEFDTATRVPDIHCHNTCSDDDIGIVLSQILALWIYRKVASGVTQQALLINPLGPSNIKKN